MIDIVIESIKHGIMITVFVFVMMMIIDYLNVLSKGRLIFLFTKSKFNQYAMASFLGATPGCLGAFMNVSFYLRGLITFGAVTAGMIATSGDEAFVMLSLFPGEALLLFAIMFVVGIVSGVLIDKITVLLKIKTCLVCKDSSIHDHDECRILNFKDAVRLITKMSFIRFLLLVIIITSIILIVLGIIGSPYWDWKRITFLALMGFALFIILTVPDHYLEEHIWQHIFKKHLWKIFLWSFCVLLIIHVGLEFWDLDAFISRHMVWVVVLAGITGLIPESGPHLIFVMLFSKGMIPFSVLLTSSIVQDGHGMLPLLSYSVKDSLLVKLFNLIIGLLLGFVLFFLNL